MILPYNDLSRSRAADVVRAGGVIGFRTDTFYGLGADPFNDSAVRRIKELKGREDNKPILLLISDRDQVERVIFARAEYFDLLANEFWPGPLTIIGPAVESLSSGITAGTKTVGVRLPDDLEVRKLVEVCGGLLTATSANPSGKEPGESAQQVQNYFEDQLDLILDSGDVSVAQPSTVVDASTNGVHIVREGAVSRKEIEAILRL